LTQIPDGLSSSAILIQYLNSIYPDFIKNHLTYNLHSGKQHGILAKNVPDNIKLVIVPDAAVRMEEQKTLKNRGIDTIIIDHHDIIKDSKFSILVNNQISEEFPSKQLVGVGMMLKFLQALDDELGLNNAKQYLDLVALGHVSDIADIRDPLVNYYIHKGFNQINNPFFKDLIEKQSFSMKGEVNPTSIGWYVVPLLNGCIRSGTQEEKEMTLKALLGSDEQVYYKRGKCYESIQKHMARQLTNIKRRQDKARDISVNELEKIIKDNHLDNDKILFVVGDETLEKNFSGLICGKLANEYKRPTLVGKPLNGEYVTGSIRGYEKGVVKDFKQVLQDTGKFEFVEGHAQAAGFQIKQENIPLVVEQLNEKYKNITIDASEYDVDFVVPSFDFNFSLIKEIYKYHSFWGHGTEEPLLVVKGLELTRSDIELVGKNSKNLKFKHKDIEYIKFRYDEDTYNNIFAQDGTYTIDIIGRCGMNEWQGHKTPQVIMEDFEIKSVKKTDWADLF
jgi:single-stranded-DNA-specific exonuclease